MPLTLTQIDVLAEAFNIGMSPTELAIFTDLLGFNLNNEVPPGSVKERAREFIKRMNSNRPPRDSELLEMLQRMGNNANLQALARQLSRRPFFSPTNDEHDAILLGDLQTAPEQTKPFVAREPLRQKIKAFTLNPGVNSPHVLIIHGDQSCGKSYSWIYIRHLATHFNVNAKPVRLRDGLSTPLALVQGLAGRLQLAEGVPQMTDDPQLSRITPLVDWFMNRLDRLTQPYWLVIDDLNDPKVTPAVLETVYELALRVEYEKPKNLWLMLLGYNLPITDPDFMPAEEAALFPDASLVARHFEWVAAPVAPLTPQRAREIADVLFSAFPSLDKESMQKLEKAILTMDLKLANGEQP